MRAYMRLTRVFLLALLGLATGLGQQSGTNSKPAKKAGAVAPENNATPKSSTPSGEKTVARPKSFDLSAMDKNVNPCDDFYEYAGGTWRKNNPIPADQARWGRFNELAEYNRQILHQILEKASANDPKRTPVMQKIGDMYQSCMDESAVNSKGASPLKPELDRIAAISNKDELISTIAY